MSIETTTQNRTEPGRSEPPAASPVGPHYQAPGRITRSVMNPTIARLTRWGVSVWGSRLLDVPGRTTGEVRTTPVNVLGLDGRRYLVAPRGETQWVRNVRVAGGAALRVGRRSEQVVLVEVEDADKAAIIRAYLRRWKWEVGQFFDGVGPDSSDDELLAISSRHPVFAIVD
jgi:deazaflavin-dependent oxidoreductase (nitroreductase family)